MSGVLMHNLSLIWSLDLGQFCKLPSLDHPLWVNPMGPSVCLWIASFDVRTVYFDANFVGQHFLIGSEVCCWQDMLSFISSEVQDTR